MKAQASAYWNRLVSEQTTFVASFPMACYQCQNWNSWLCALALAKQASQQSRSKYNSQARSVKMSYEYLMR